MTEHSQYANRIYMRNALRAAQRNRAIRKELCNWFRDNEDEVEKLNPSIMQAYNDLLKGYVPRRRATREPDPLEEIAIREKQTEFLNRTIKILDDHTRREPAPAVEAMATRLVVEHFSLGPVAAAVLELARRYAYLHRSLVESLWDALRDAVGGYHETTALLINCTRDEVIDALYELYDRGIFDYDREHRHFRDTTPQDLITSLFERVWHPPVRNAAELQERLVSRPCKAALSMDDFAHLDGRDDALIDGNADDLYRFSEGLERTIATQHARPRLGMPVEPRLPWQAFSHRGQDAEDVRRTLAVAVQSRQKGINILLYGPPGTGKTEFARTLCGAVGTRLYAIGDNEVGADARLSVNRSATLDYALEALADEQNAAILFDEMEDFRSVEKLWLNRIVEENPVPIIWACNAIGYYRMWFPFFIDRMLHAIEFRHMPSLARQRVYTDIMHETHLPALETRQLAEELARNPKVTPRQVAMAVDQAAMVNGNAETIRRSVAQKEKLRHGIRPADTLPIAQYDPSLVHADIDMAELAARMVALGPRRFALCLSGPPGTGKTAFARHIAEQMGIDILPKRASDLLNKYVGGTENRIASAFAEAIETRSFLVFDEVDSLLMDRQSAQRSWEVSMVNELLSQMERHSLPFACTTNQRDALDPAATRRFQFHAEFRYLDPPRIRRAFDLFFNAKAPAPVLALTKLTPADFANIRERAEVLGFLDDPNRIADALASECHAKPGATQTGF